VVAANRDIALMIEQSVKDMQGFARRRRNHFRVEWGRLALRRAPLTGGDRRMWPPPYRLLFLTEEPSFGRAKASSPKLPQQRPGEALHENVRLCDGGHIQGWQPSSSSRPSFRRAPPVTCTFVFEGHANRPETFVLLHPSLYIFNRQR
jgi:hypothetical protein